MLTVHSRTITTSLAPRFVTVTNHASLRTADKDYINKNVSTLNKFTDLKNNVHWAYYEIMEAANTHKAVFSANAENLVK